MSQAEVAAPMPLVRPREGSGARVRAVVDAEYDLLWRSLRRLGVAESSVEDAAQQVLLVLARRIDEVAPGAERSFLLSTAVRVASDHRRKQARVREFADERALEAEPFRGPDAGELLDAQRARVLLDEALGALPMELRAVFVLYEFEEMTMAAIAAALELPPGTVASRLRRARATFETTLQALDARVEARRPP